MGEEELQPIESINRKLAPALIFVAVTVWFFQSFIMGSDLFWHLAAGRELCQQGHLLKTDPFSYSFEGKEWVNHEWLWDILYWNVYQFGPDAVAWFNIGILVAIFGLGYWISYRMCESVFASGFAVWFAAATCHWFLDIRPHLITLLLVSFVLLTREKKWAPWMWPVLVVIWTNLHAGFSFGVGMIGLLVLVRTIQNSWKERRLVINWWQWLSVALCLGAMFVNPYGWRMFGHQLDYLGGESLYTNLIEWRPPFEDIRHITFDWTYYAGCFFCFVVLAVLGVSIGGWKNVYLVALCSVSLTMAFVSRRFIPLFVVTSVPFVALFLKQLRDYVFEKFPALKSPWAGVAVSAGALVVAAAMWSQVKIEPSLLRHWSMSDVYPEEAIEYLKALGPPERVLNYYNWGGFIMLHAPGAKVFIDGRANTLYDEIIYRDYQTFLAGQVSPSRLARYPADIALLPPGPFVQALQRLRPPWKIIYESPRAVILLPPDSPLLTADLPDPNVVTPNGVQPIVKKSADLASRGEGQQAADLLEHALEIQPYSIRIVGMLAHLYAKMGQFDQLTDLIDRALHESPRQHFRIHSLEGMAYERMGKLEEALNAYKQAVNNSPFSRREATQQRVKELETQIRRQARGF